MVFRDWEPAAEYFTDTQDVASDFYRPCMRDAVRYDRIAGYFSSAIYLIVWAEMVDFAARGGRIRVICSPLLSAPDARSIADAYRARTDVALAESLLSEYHRLIQHPYLAEPAMALAGLIVDGVVDFRIAEVSSQAKASSRSMFHDKTGLFFDDNEDAIGFRGGINETLLGFGVGGNVDSITVWTSWAGGREAELISSNTERFERMWRGDARGVMVHKVPDIALEKFSRIAAESGPWQIKAEAIAVQEYLARQHEPATGFSLRPHQQKAIESWETAGRVGLLKHATATGKTFMAIEAIRRGLLDGYRPVVLVPSAILVDQWTSELREHLSDLRVRVHPCGAGHSIWINLLDAWLGPTEEYRVVVSTIKTASSAKFLGHLKRASGRLFLVVDEAHRLGAPQAMQLTEVTAAARLGLSATPERAGDPDGTRALLKYFGGVVDTFTLEDALNTDPPILTPYAYEPLVVRLSDDEQNEWDELSRRISRLVARYGLSDELQDRTLQQPDVKRLLIQRARVIKKARAKTLVARSVVGKYYREGQRWLIYCEDQDQLRDVVAVLLDAKLPVTEYHSAMSGDRAATLGNFAANGGVVVSIRCLDEGVDIPVATHALILASSRNPREFIQRRGRVLRRTEGKAYAQIYDTIVVPTQPLEASGRSMILGELARAAEFANSAFTKAGLGELEHAFVEAGGKLTDPDVSGGFEADDD